MNTAKNTPNILDNKLDQAPKRGQAYLDSLEPMKQEIVKSFESEIINSDLPIFDYINPHNLPLEQAVSVVKNGKKAIIILASKEKEAKGWSNIPGTLVAEETILGNSEIFTKWGDNFSQKGREYSYLELTPAIAPSTAVHITAHCSYIPWGMIPNGFISHKEISAEELNDFFSNIKESKVEEKPNPEKRKEGIDKKNQEGQKNKANKEYNTGYNKEEKGYNKEEKPGVFGKFFGKK